MQESAETRVADITHLAEGIETQTARRSDLYRLFASAFEFPSEELVRAVRSGDLRAVLDGTVAGLPYPLPAGGAGLTDAGESDDALEIDYIRIFDVGAGGGPPCSLCAGNWTGDRLRAMEECLRFYEHFGLGLPDPKPDLPDHLCIALEFMHYLSFRQVEAQRAGDQGDDYIRAQRDFLARQILSWFPKMTAKLGGENPPPFYESLAALALAFLQAEKAYLAGLL